MGDELDDLKNLWQSARPQTAGRSADTGAIIRLARQKMKQTVQLQLGTVLTLLVTAVGLSAFFTYVAPFRHTLSHIGIGLMVGGLAVRILIELVSVYLATTINLGEPALKTTGAASTYFRFRSRINGPVTIGIVILYTIGFYLLTPEFSLYFSKSALLLIDLSYIPAAAIFTWFIRATVRKEMASLREILRIQTDLTGDRG